MANQATQDSVSSIIYLVVGMGVAVLVLILVGSMGGQTFQLVEDDITGIGYTAVANESHNYTSGDKAPYNTTHAYGIIPNTLFIYSTDGPNLGQAHDLSNFDINYWTGSINVSNTTNASGYMGVNIQYVWGNTSIENSVKGGITSSFEAVEQTGDYLPIIVLAVIITLVLSIVLGFTAFGGGGGMAPGFRGGTAF